jgi:hypothetical protein
MIPAATPVLGAVSPAMMVAGSAGLAGSSSATTGSTAKPTLISDPSQPGDQGGDPATGDVPMSAGPMSSPAGLSGAIGAGQDDGSGSAGSPAQARDHAAGESGFNGTIGRPQHARTSAGRQLPGGHHGQRDHEDAAPDAAHGGRQAPAAGYSLGRDSSGPVLRQLAVPDVTAKPPTMTSSPINSKLVPSSGNAQPGQGSGGPGGLSASAGPQAPASSPAGSDSGPAGMTEPGMLPPGGVTTSGIGAGAAGGPAMSTAAGGPATGTPAGQGTPMMPMRGGMPGGQGSDEGHRLAYLPEDDEYWGTAPHHALLGADGNAGFDESAETGFEPAITAGLGIGAPAGEPITDRRTP